MSRKVIHIGELIQTFVKENHINSAQLARSIGKTRQNMYDLYQRDDVEVKLVLAISEALKHNFFEDIYPNRGQLNDKSIEQVFDVLKDLVAERVQKKSG